jgi:hypothetical protein
MWHVAQLLFTQHMPCWMEDSCRSWHLLMHWQRRIPYSEIWNEDTDEGSACIFLILSLSCCGKVKRISILQISHNVAWYVTNNALKVGPNSWQAMKNDIMLCPKSYLHVAYSHEGNVVVNQGHMWSMLRNKGLHAAFHVIGYVPCT